MMRQATVCVIVALMPLLGGAVPLTAQPVSAWQTPPVGSVEGWYSTVPNNFSAYAVSSSDPWWARDKLQHLTFSFLWTLSTQYVLVEKADWSRSAALPAAVGSGATVGLSKELFDWRLGPTRRFSTRDLAADAVGILLAVGVILL